MDKLVIKIDDMSCEHCEAAVQNAICALPGVKKARASHGKKEAVVEYDAALVSAAQITQAVEDTGYTVIG